MRTSQQNNTGILSRLMRAASIGSGSVAPTQSITVSALDFAAVPLLDHDMVNPAFRRDTTMMASQPNPEFTIKTVAGPSFSANKTGRTSQNHLENSNRYALPSLAH